MTAHSDHRLEGLEPDNLLAFLALLGLLRALRESRPDWRPRVFWDVDSAPLRPVLRAPTDTGADDVLAAAASGIGALAARHEFGDLRDLKLPPGDATERLQRAAGENGYAAELWSALVSDAAVASDGAKAEPTPLCLIFGQGHQHFMSRLASVPQTACPPDRGAGRKKMKVSEIESLREALFAPWERPDATDSFRWDPVEDVRYALRARNPSTDKETTQHAANRLGAIGLSTITVVPRCRGPDTRLEALGGARGANGSFSFGWPIWRGPMGLDAIGALLGHPALRAEESAGVSETRAALGIVEYRRARRISVGKFMNFTRAAPHEPGPATGRRPRRSSGLRDAAAAARRAIQ